MKIPVTLNKNSRLKKLCKFTYYGKKSIHPVQCCAYLRKFTNVELKL